MKFHYLDSDELTSSSSNSLSASQIVGILEGPFGDAVDDKRFASDWFLEISSAVVVTDVLDWLRDVAALIGM